MYQIVVETNASDLAICAVLSVPINWRLHPNPFYSRQMNNEVINYEIQDEELLATVFALKG